MKLILQPKISIVQSRGDNVDSSVFGHEKRMSVQLPELASRAVGRMTELEKLQCRADFLAF